MGWIGDAFDAAFGKDKVKSSTIAQPMPTYGSNGADADINRYRGLGAAAATTAAPQLDQTFANQSRAQEMGSLGDLMNGANGSSEDMRGLSNAAEGATTDMGLLRTAAEGNAPSAAEILGRQQSDRALNSQVSAAGNVRGGPAAQAAAYRFGSGNAMLQRADMNQGIQAQRATELANARGAYSTAEEGARKDYATAENTARGQYGTATQGVRSQDLQAADRNASFQQTQNQQNQQAQQYYENLGQQTKQYATGVAQQGYGAAQAQANANRTMTSGENNAATGNLFTLVKGAAAAGSGVNQVGGEGASNTTGGSGSSSSGSSGSSTPAYSGEGGGTSGDGGAGDGFARGGYAPSGKRAWVGEQGPELVLAGGLAPLMHGSFVAREHGGPVAGGDVALVGEKGPEFVRFQKDATVIPAPQTAAMVGGGDIGSSLRRSVADERALPEGTRVFHDNGTVPLDEDTSRGMLLHQAPGADGRAFYAPASQPDTSHPSLSGGYTGPGASSGMQSDMTAPKTKAAPPPAAKPRGMTLDELMAAARALGAQQTAEHTARMAQGPAVVAREEGGPVAKGQTALVGEKGPELVHKLPPPKAPPVGEASRGESLPPLPPPEQEQAPIRSMQNRPIAHRMRQQPAPSYDTALSPTEEKQFAAWKQQYAPRDSGGDYDLRGAFKSGFKPDANGHWPDTYKKPNHPTFSDESVYAKGSDAARAGHWEGDRFTPPAPAAAREPAPNPTPLPAPFAPPPDSLAAWQAAAAEAGQPGAVQAAAPGILDYARALQAERPPVTMGALGPLMNDVPGAKGDPSRYRRGQAAQP